MKARAAAKEAKADPAGKALINAVRAIDKALEVAKEQKAEGSGTGARGEPGAAQRGAGGDGGADAGREAAER